MKNINKAHCFFEQSGTFKNEFIKLGIPAEDYDTIRMAILFKDKKNKKNGKRN